MTEIEIKVKVIKVYKRCISCNEGHMKPTGKCFPMIPALYEHRCINCHNVAKYEKVYPYLRHESE